jgi:alpha-1,2-mannosyltransferase
LTGKPLLSQFREADWLNARNVRLYAALILVLNGLLPLATRWLSGHDLIDRQGTPFGGDYISFYAASKLALSGHAVDVWHPGAHRVAENSVFNRDLGYWAFFYPPAYLLFCLPLALVSYGWSLVIAMGATAAAAVRLTLSWFKRIRPEMKGGWLPVLAFPGIWMNIACGQNAALTTAIMAGGCLLLNRAPILSGLVFGMMVIKPQLAIAIPFILAADGRWKTFFATGFSAATLSLAALLLVGPAGYAAFFANGAMARQALENGLVEISAMQSLFAALKVLGASNAIAYAAQALLAIGVLGWSSVVIRRHRPDYLAIGALLAVVTPLLSPFLLNYDLLMLALPLGWIILQGVRTGFRPWEKMLCLWIFILPVLVRGLADLAHLPLGAISIIGLYWLVQARITEMADIAMPAGLKSAV